MNYPIPGMPGVSNLQPLQSTPYQMPGSNPYQAMLTGGQQLTRVTGLDGAKAYQMGPNSTAALFDNDQDRMYIKITDGAGFPTIRVFDFSEVDPAAEARAQAPDYITRKEMEEYVKQFVRPETTTGTEPDTNGGHQQG